MLKKIVTAGCLAVIAASAMAAQHTSEADSAAATTDTSSMATRFKRLDTDGNGLLSRAEAAANPAVSSVFNSLDTNATLEADAKHSTTDGITLDQFEAGMQARQTGGTVGPPASGGGTYLVYPDGSKKKVEGTGVGAKKH